MANNESYRQDSPSPRPSPRGRGREVASDILFLAGTGVVVYAGFLLHSVVGWFLLGLALIGLAWVIGLEEKK